MNDFCILGGKVKHSGKEPLPQQSLKVVCVVSCDAQTHKSFKILGLPFFIIFIFLVGGEA